MTLNNPLVLVGLTMLGFGLEFAVERTEKGWAACVMVQALVWSRTYSWGD